MGVPAVGVETDVVAMSRGMTGGGITTSFTIRTSPMTKGSPGSFSRGLIGEGW